MKLRYRRVLRCEGDNGHICIPTDCQGSCSNCEITDLGIRRPEMGSGATISSCMDLNKSVRLTLRFLICEMGIMIIPISQDYFKNQ